MGFGRLPQLLIQTLDGLVSARPRILKIDTVSMTAVDNKDGSLTLGATGGVGGGSLQYTVENQTGSTLTKGTVVFDTNASAVGIQAQGLHYDFSNPPLGLVSADILNTATGTVIGQGGTVTGLDTHLWIVGTQLYAGINGALTDNPGTHYNHAVGWVTVSDATVGAVDIVITEEGPPDHGHTTEDDGGPLAIPIFNEIPAASAPTPGALTQTLFIDSGDHKLKRKDSTAAVTTIESGGAGTVTSVQATVPTGFSVSGGPITTSGTLAVTLDSQTANKVLASGTSGGSATPGFRALVAADIPAIAESGVTSLVTDLGLKAPIADPTFTGITTAPEFSASGLTGATAASRYVGGTTSGAPVSGTFIKGDWISDQTGVRWTCTTGGTPGTWAQEPGTGGSSLYSAYLVYQDQKTSGTTGGTFTSGAWRTRDITTEVVDTGNNGTLASNQITLLAGTYDCLIFAPANQCNRHAARLQNVTDAITLVSGTGMYGSTLSSTYSEIAGRFTLAATKTLEVQHQCQTTASSDGFGIAAGSSFTVATEIYTSAQFWKV